MKLKDLIMIELVKNAIICDSMREKYQYSEIQLGKSVEDIIKALKENGVIDAQVFDIKLK